MNKKILTVITLGLIFAGFLLVSWKPSSKAKVEESAGAKTNKFDDEVVACFEEVNAFRTGKEAWYWNKDNSTKTNLVGKLDELVLDEELCKAAQIRAKEIVKKFSHTRPNGKDCFSVLDENSIDYHACGENIAAGSETGRDTFIQWKEDDEKYSGQGHRRNMLDNYTRIGIAYAYDPSSDYEYYWVMELAR